MPEEKETLYFYEMGRIRSYEVDRYNEKSFWINGRSRRRFTSFSKAYTKDEVTKMIEDALTILNDSLSMKRKKLLRLEKEIDKIQKRINEFEELSTKLNEKDE